MTYINFFAQDCLKLIPSPQLTTKKVLVVGCGGGNDCASFTSAAIVHGIDICENLGKDFSHPQVSYFRESATAMERPSDYYDLVFSVATLEHVHHLEAAYQEIWRVTKPGGLIYCVASPLWNSYQGHHLYEIFPEVPWVHLRFSPSEISQQIDLLYQEESDQDMRVKWINHIYSQGLMGSNDINENPTTQTCGQILSDFMFSDYFNHLPAKDYLTATTALPVSYIIKNDFWQDGESLLTPELLQELQEKGFTKDELLSVSHSYVAIK